MRGALRMVRVWSVNVDGLGRELKVTSSPVGAILCFQTHRPVSHRLSALVQWKLINRQRGVDHGLISGNDPNRLTDTCIPTMW